MPRFYPGWRWGTKPPPGSQIDWEQGISVGIQECYLFNEWAGKLVQNIGPSGVGPLTSSAATWPSALPSPYGGGLAVGAASQTCFSPSTVAVGNQTSIVLAFSRTATAVNNGFLVAIRQSNATGSQIIIQYDASHANLNLTMDNSGGTAQTLAIAASNVGLNTTNLLVATFDRPTGNCNAWLNGTAFSRAGTVVSASASPVYAIACGASTANAGQQAQTQALLIKYNRLLTAGEAGGFLNDPWCFMLPTAMRRYWVVSATAAAYAHRTVGNRAGSRTIRPVTGGL